MLQTWKRRFEAKHLAVGEKTLCFVSSLLKTWEIQNISMLTRPLLNKLCSRHENTGFENIKQRACLAATFLSNCLHPFDFTHTKKEKIRKLQKYLWKRSRVGQGYPACHWVCEMLKKESETNSKTVCRCVGWGEGGIPRNWASCDSRQHSPCPALKKVCQQFCKLLQTLLLNWIMNNPILAVLSSNLQCFRVSLFKRLLNMYFYERTHVLYVWACPMSQ